MVCTIELLFFVLLFDIMKRRKAVTDSTSNDEQRIGKRKGMKVSI